MELCVRDGSQKAWRLVPKLKEIKHKAVKKFKYSTVVGQKCLFALAGSNVRTSGDDRK